MSKDEFIKSQDFGIGEYVEDDGTFTRKLASQLKKGGVPKIDGMQIVITEPTESKLDEILHNLLMEWRQDGKDGQVEAKAKQTIKQLFQKIVSNNNTSQEDISDILNAIEEL